MIAVDTNILVYSHRKDSSFHRKASQRIIELAEGQKNWGIPWPCLHEFFGVVTHPRIFSPPTPLSQALEQIDAWLASPSVQLLREEVDYWKHLKTLVVNGNITGPAVHDARIAAICLTNNVSALWSADRDYSRMQGLEIVNPLLAQ